MAKQGLLSDARSRPRRAPSRYHDGGGLYFAGHRSGSRSWVYRFRIHRRARTMGLGAYPECQLKEARARACRGQEAARRRHRSDRRARGRRAMSRPQRSRSRTPARATSRRSGRSGRPRPRRADPSSGCSDYVYPIIGHLPIADIKARRSAAGAGADLDDEEPDRRRGCANIMEDVINWAIHEGIRADEINPWEIKRLQFALPLGIHKVTSHPSLPFEQAPAFLAELRAAGGRQGQGDGVRDADRGAHRRHLRRRQGAFASR